MSRKKYISILHSAAEENGGKISFKAFRDLKYTPSPQTIANYFGSWTKALEAAGLKTYEQPSKRYSKEEIILALQKYAKENEGTLTLTLYVEKKYKPSETTIRKKFGSWNHALMEAGVKTNRDVKRWYTEEDLICILQSIVNNGQALTVEEYKKQGKQPALETFVACFGSWNEAIRKAGLRVNSGMYSDEEMIRILKDYAKRKGRFTSLDYIKDGIQPKPLSIQRRFGSWMNALRIAGIKPTYVNFTNQELLEELKRCIDLNKTDYITIAEYTKLSNHPHYMTIFRRFGSWKKAIRLANTLKNV
ncbi:homing endonuclease associated repeat-containing protein [Peribacillus loiseleuriae]|uniref:Uncharacterized protein n=1 Tax=Peribacillus loiseleuriae TaxID=1679170 RepID=A0A0K9GWH9_9BACI|nr:hypothetical protein [Peribacillus loiseleuriae]KMY51054.1 hypothetical protein AC625_17220 [Peribacillus loiseleuriae]